jgi:OmpA-OmpF porin, OOP family
MFKKLSLCLFCLIFSYYAGYTQNNVQWASKVLEVSSELMPKQYSAEQALKKPNVLPVTDESPNAWTPKNPKKTEHIKVGFDNPMHIQQVAIAESYNPGSVYQIFLYDEFDKEHLVHTFSPKAISSKGRLLNVFFDMTPYKVHAVKVKFKGKVVDGYYSIDAIGISDSEIPIKVSINVAENLKKDLKSEALDERVNSEYEEVSPVVSPDGKTLFFSRKNHPENIGGEKDHEDIWYSELDESTEEWKQAKNAGRPLNNEGPNYINSISHVDSETYLALLGNEYKANGKMKDGLSYSLKSESGWSPPQALKIRNHYNLSDKSHYYLSSNKNTMLMSIERDDTYGDRDLYVSFLQEDGSWSEPINMGEDINTADEEAAPFLASDDKTLYFSSRGYSGYGGHDIYMTKRLDDSWQSWTEPQNLGPNINSNQDDLFFNIPEAGKFAYFCRGNEGERIDILRLALPIFEEPAIDDQPAILAMNNKAIKVDVKTVLEDPQVRNSLNKKSEEEKETSLTAAASAKDDTEEDIEKDIDKNKEGVRVTQTFAVNNILFDFDKASLKKDFNTELEKIKNYLLENNKVKVTISGHTDSYGPASYNLTLSEQRAKAVLAYFTENGIERERMSVKAYGKAMPLAPNDNVENRKLNRRVEFTLSDQ